MIDKSRILRFLDKVIEREERWVEDAISREDCTDEQHYESRVGLAKELKGIVERW